MYTSFFGLREKPFALSPDPRFLYLSAAHREALAHLLYGIEQGEGFIAVTGEVGTGKTTLCRTLLRRLGGEVEVAFLFNPRLSARELLEGVLTELGIEKPDSGNIREIIDALNAFLLEKRRQGRRVLLIVDEAQGLSAETLEQIRLLSNLETESAKLIQILLLGQPELDAMLESPSLRQLRQRIGVRWRLAPLSRAETGAYVHHRLGVAAGAKRDLFSDGALREIHRRSGGVPRVINLLADRALLAAYADGAQRVGPALVRKSSRELEGRPHRSRRNRWWRIAVPAVAIVLLSALGIYAGERLGWEPLELPGSISPWVAPATAPSVASPPEASPAPTDPGILQTVPPGPARVEPSAVPGSATLRPPALHDSVSVAPPALPIIADLASALAGRLPGDTAADSVAALLDAWAVPLEGVALDAPVLEDVWTELAALDLQVFELRGPDLGLVQAVGHPALLLLEAGDRAARLVALQRLDADWAELDGVRPEGRARVRVPELERVWRGTAFVVWRDFEALPEMMRIGDVGLAVAWLQEALAEAGFYPGTTSGRFDLGTELAVRAYQADRQLPPDGAVGPLTKMSLYATTPRYAMPRLADVGGVG